MAIGGTWPSEIRQMNWLIEISLCTGEVLQSLSLKISTPPKHYLDIVSYCWWQIVINYLHGH